MKTVSTALFAVLMLANVARAERMQDPLRIGVILPFTGPLAPYSNEIFQGMEVALAQINARQPDVGKMLSLVKRDDQGLAQDAEKYAKELLNGRNADVLVGSLLASTTAGLAQVAKTFDRPVLSPFSALNAVSQFGPHVFRLSLSAKTEAQAIWQFATNDLKGRRFALMWDENSLYASEFAAEILRNASGSGGGEIVAKQSYDPAQENFTRILETIQSQRVDGIFMPGFYRDVAKALNTSKGIGIRAPFLGGSSWEADGLVDITAKASVRGHFFASQFSAQDPDERAQIFVRDFRTSTTRIPSAFAALGYDTVLVLAAAYQRASNTQGKTLQSALMANRKYETSVGLGAFDNDRNFVKPVVVQTTTVDGFRFRSKVRIE